MADCIISNDIVFCLGDLNINFLNTDSYEYTYLNSLLELFNLTQIVSKPTRVTPSSSTLLDLIMINEQKIVIYSGVISLPQFSDHHLVYCVIDLPIQKKNTPDVILTRDIKNINLIEFENHASNIDWNYVCALDNIDNKVAFLENKITQLFNVHAPLRKVRITKKYNPWITTNVKLMMRIRDRALSDYRSSLKNLNMSREVTEAKWVYYKEMRNFVTASIRREKKSVY